MRIGIVTIYDNTNMGNRLQNYALQQVLRCYADDVVTIETKYRDKSPLKNMLRNSPLADSATVYDLLGKHRKAKLLRFSKAHIRVSKHRYWFNGDCKPLKKSDQCDLYCAGSDQVWNPYTGRKGLFNYLGFAPSEKTFSYAASFGIDKVPPEFAPEIRAGLNHIRHISVREEAGAQIVKDLTGREDARVLVDPTMLLTVQQWDALAKKPEKPVPQKYLLTYFLGKVSPERKKAVEDLAQSRGCAIIALKDPKDPFYAIDPAEFVYLIKHADCVCTDSFHGSVFSFLYQRPLAIFQRHGSADDMSSRLRTLTEKFGLEDCLVRKDSQIRLPDGDYTPGYAALDRERQKTDAFLRMIIT